MHNIYIYIYVYSSTHLLPLWAPIERERDAQQITANLSKMCVYCYGVCCCASSCCCYACASSCCCCCAPFCCCFPSFCCYLSCCCWHNVIQYFNQNENQNQSARTHGTRLMSCQTVTTASKATIKAKSTRVKSHARHARQ